MAGTMIRRLTARDARLSSFRYYDLLVHVFVVVLLISNLVGQKVENKFRLDTLEATA